MSMTMDKNGRLRQSWRMRAGVFLTVLKNLRVCRIDIYIFISFREKWQKKIVGLGENWPLKKTKIATKFCLKLKYWLYNMGTFRVQELANGEFLDQSRASGEGCHSFPTMYNTWGSSFGGNGSQQWISPQNGQKQCFFLVTNPDQLTFERWYFWVSHILSIGLSMVLGICSPIVPSSPFFWVSYG